MLITHQATIVYPASGIQTDILKMFCRANEVALTYKKNLFSHLNLYHFKVILYRNLAMIYFTH